ncbi:glutathione S-transferase family protein [Pararobbsia alpina]|uniref:Glutathione S-transferase GstB n=1 Tax=Pararobbsia alpina TaxID=621374 RepID=A0A6S7BCZ9_9BURK|nr:glutathione S-transferase [Pararobbsia alpina]CAB3795233.1 Glutathione S-transferase GstB [Pararobbsia alpina]
MMQIWGRVNSVNVQKVLWCCDELGLVYERFDAGMEFGRTDEPSYRAMNPNGRIPTIMDEDFVLWESNSILRYLAMQYGKEATLYPVDARLRAAIDRWLDWSLSTLQPAERPVFWGMVRTPPHERDMASIAAEAKKVAVLWGIVDAHLVGRDFLEGAGFSLADIVLGAYARRWFGLEGIERPPLHNLARWYEGLGSRSGFVKFVAPTLT